MRRKPLGNPHLKHFQKTQAERGCRALLPLISCLLGCLPTTGHAANLTTTNVQAGGTSWTAAIWKTNSSGMATNTGPFAAPIAGNTYETVFNGTSIGNGSS